jgi:hypothetical protein
MTIFCTLSISNIFVNTSGSDLFVLLSPVECEGEGVFGQGQRPHRNCIIGTIRHYRVLLHQPSQNPKTDQLHHLGTHAAPLAAAERQEMVRFGEAIVFDEPLRLEHVRLLPQLFGHAEVVVVQEDDGALLYVIT